MPVGAYGKGGAAGVHHNIAVHTDLVEFASRQFDLVLLNLVLVCICRPAHWIIPLCEPSSGAAKEEGRLVYLTSPVDENEESDVFIRWNTLGRRQSPSPLVSSLLT